MTPRALTLATVLSILPGCAAGPPPAPSAPAPAAAPVAPEAPEAPAPEPAPPAITVDEGGAVVFATAGYQGTFVLAEVGAPGLVVVGPERLDTRYLPASTFKLPNTMIGLSTGVIPGRDFALPWDGVERWAKGWNRDHDLASAMAQSVVWFYQEIARRIGLPRMQAWLDRLDYGNRQAGQVVDRFWLDGPIAISPREQVDFLARWHAGALPIAPAHADLVHDLIVLGEGDGWVLRGKTGLGVEPDRVLGWLVGCVHRGERTWLYATLVMAPPGSERALFPVRRALSEALLRRHGVLPR